jgi:hypothetical protein
MRDIDKIRRLRNREGFVLEGGLEVRPDSTFLDDERLGDLLMKRLHKTSVAGKNVRLGRARLSIEWLEEGHDEGSERE